MAYNRNFRLCGGTFFLLLLKANENCEDSQDLRFRDFLGVIDPAAVADIGKGEVDKLHTYASKFRNCNVISQNSKYVRLGNEQICAMFKDELKDDKDAALNRVVQFCDNYIPKGVRSWLVRAILELINEDITISGNAIFYAKPGFLPTFKSELLSEDAEIYFYNFLLSVWYYVYEKKIDNTEGKRTVQTLQKTPKEYTEGKFDSNAIGVSDEYKDVRINFDIMYSDDDESEETETISDDALVYMTEDDIAPDLGMFNPEVNIAFISAKEVNEPRRGKFSKYVEAAYNKHSKKRTFIYDVERPFRDFYVCNDLAIRTSYSTRAVDFFAGVGAITYPRHHNNMIKNVTFLDFQSLKNVIVGQGGLGKTMMVNHIFLSMLENYGENGYFPIFTTLSDYVPEEKNLLYLISQAVTRYDTKLQLSDVVQKLEEGDNVILLDGLDEIKKEYLVDFIKELDYLCDQYQENMIIISTRNIPEIRNLNGFQPYDLQPLTEEQAFDMINKLDPVYIDNTIKTRFISDVKSRRFRFNENEKKEFFGNPLFLTIMLISYSQTNNIPTQRYLFYEQAYRAMATRHDGLKGITRNFNTGLNEREFQRVLGQFCADSYADYQLKFEPHLLNRYLQKVIDDNQLNTTTELFLKDITEKLCLMYLDGTEYRFIHRSFQEYFAAYYFTTLLDEEYKDVYDVLNHLDEKIVSDETVPMLFGLDSKKFNKYISLPFLESIFVNDGDESDYKDFLLRFYSEIEYVTGDLDDEIADNRIRSALYSFISQHFRIREYICGGDFDFEEDWADVFQQYYTVEDYRNDAEYGECSIVDSSGLYVYTDEDGEPYEDVEIDEAGCLCTVYVKETFNDGRWDLINDSVFPLKIEFENLKKLYDGLLEENAVKPVKKKRFGLN